MIRLRAFAGFASLLFALAFMVTTAQAQTGSGTTTDPNATNQTQTTDQYNQQQTTPTDQTSPTTGYPNTATDYDRDRGPDLGWLGLLGLAGLLGLKRRPVHHTREDDVRGGRPATV